MAESLRSPGIPIGPADSSVPDVPVNTEPDPLCATCGYLRWLYGDNDTELVAHIDAEHSDDNSIPKINSFIADLNNNSPAN